MKRSRSRSTTSQPSWEVLLPNQDFWTPERIVYLTNRWEARASATVIGNEMGCSRCAVLGKAHRLGLPSHKGVRMTEEQRKASRANTDAKRFPKRVRRSAKEVKEKRLIEMPTFNGSLNIPFADLRHFSNQLRNQCRFIAAEPPGPDYLACGNETVPGASYCQNCGPRMRANHSNTPAERAHAIRMGTREHLRAMRKAAA